MGKGQDEGEALGFGGLEDVCGGRGAAGGAELLEATGVLLRELLGASFGTERPVDFAVVVGAGSAAREGAVGLAPAGEDLEAGLAAVAVFPVLGCGDALAGFLDVVGCGDRGDVAVLFQLGLRGYEVC